MIGAYYAYTPGKSFDEFDSSICALLREGFQRRIVLELMKPRNLVPCFVNFVAAHVCAAAGRVMKGIPTLHRYPSRTDMFYKVLHRDLFHGLTMSSPRRHDLEVVIGACELRTGSAFRFGSNQTGGWRHGRLADGQIDLAFAVAASAAYPILLPAFDRTWRFVKKGEESYQRVLLTDGGIYDNLGLQVLEPGRDADVSLHTFPCDYLIACNADQGQRPGSALSTAFFARVVRSFETVHRRVQESTMHRLHHLKEAGKIKAFALPYLGQQDGKLPWKPGSLVPREDVVNYPTDFAPMSDSWIEKLANRGEQLTRATVSYYLRDII